MKSILLLLGVISLTQARILPDYLTPYLCHKSDPNFEKCFANKFKKAFAFIKKGIPEVSLPPLDPLEIPEFEVDMVLEHLAEFKGKIRNFKVNGFSQAIFEKLKANAKNLSGEVRARLPFMRAEFDYEMRGHFFEIPINSIGSLSGNFTGTAIAMKLKMKTVDKNGVKYFQVDRAQSKSEVRDGKVKINASDPDYADAASLVEHIYNDNTRLFMDVVNPIYVKYLNEFLQILINKYFGKFPANELLLE